MKEREAEEKEERDGESDLINPVRSKLAPNGEEYNSQGKERAPFSSKNNISNHNNNNLSLFNILFFSLSFFFSKKKLPQTENESVPLRYSLFFF